MKTEEEARKCWCPFARIARTGSNGSITAVNIAMIEGHETRVGCIASERMAWRWYTIASAVATTEGAKFREGTGYCGLAGQPRP